MVYIFEREDEHIQIDIRRSSSRTFHITCRYPDGTTTQEACNGETSFRSRLDEIRAELEHQAWQTAGPELLADGWKI